MKYIVGSGSVFNPVYKIKGHITDHVKDKDRKCFVSTEFTHELYTEDFWVNLKQLAKENNMFVKLYA